MKARLPGLGWPTLCCVCHAWSDGRVCRACVARFAAPVPRCGRCALRVPAGIAECADCRRRPPPFVHTVVAADYAFPWDGVVTRFKFHEGLDLADALADLLADAVRAAGRPAVACVLPVPLGPARLAERGYNQSALLASRVARRLGLRWRDDLLQRLVDTPHQTGLALKARRAGLRGCFGVPAHAGGGLRGQAVALVDDVVTTGATVDEAARTLLGAGASQVQVWAVARTPPPADA